MPISSANRTAPTAERVFVTWAELARVEAVCRETGCDPSCVVRLALASSAASESRWFFERHQ